MNATINEEKISFTPGETVLAAARRSGHFIPSLCAFAPLNHAPESCRVCLVDCTFPSGASRIVPACATPLEEGMSVRTNSSEVLARQRLQVELLLADHDLACDTCPRHGKCELQDLAAHVGLNGSRFRFPAQVCQDRSPNGKDASAPALVMDPAKCVRCLRCATACREQGLNALAPEGEGLKARMGFVGSTSWGDSPRCVQCGQCSRVCPVGAIAVPDAPQLADWLADPSITTFVFFPSSVAPSLEQTCKLPPASHPADSDSLGRLAAGLRRLGVDFVGNADCGAEHFAKAEAAELTRRLRDKGTLPLFSSFCPAWLSYVKKQRPDLLPHLSGVPSPLAALSSQARDHLKAAFDLAPEQVRIILISTCTAAKADSNTAVDALLTVRHCADLLLSHGIRLDELSPEGFDAPFTTTPCPTPGKGDLARAVAREASGETFKTTAHAGFVGLSPLLDEAVRGTSPYAYIEVMACQAGCSEGGGAYRL